MKIKNKKPEKKSKGAQLRDLRFFTYSVLQGLVVLVSFLLFLELFLYNPEKKLNRFISEQKDVLAAEINLCSATVSNYCIYAYVQYLQQYTNLLKRVDSIASNSISDCDNKNSQVLHIDNSQKYNDLFIDDYRFYSFNGVSRFSAFGLDYVFSVGDTWLDGSLITQIFPSCFSTTSGTFFSRKKSSVVHPVDLEVAKK